MKYSNLFFVLDSEDSNDQSPIRYEHLRLAYTMPESLKYLFLLFLVTGRLSAHLVTSIITVVETNSSTTPCTELSPITNRMQWAQQCTMALSNILPKGNVPAATSTCAGSYCSAGSTTSIKELSTRSSISGPETGSTTSTRRSHTSRNSSTTASTTTAGSSAGDVTANRQTSSNTNVGVIAGAVSCVLAVVALLAWILLRTRNKWLGYFKSSNVGYADAHEKYWWDNRSFQVPDRDPTPKFWSRSPQELDQSPTAPYDVRHIGSGMDGVTDCGYARSYAVMNPDPPSASTLTDRSRADSIPSWLQSEPTDDGDDALRPDSNIFSQVTRNMPNDVPDTDGCPHPMAPPMAYTPYRPGVNLRLGNRPRSSYLTPEEAMSGGWRNYTPEGE